MATASSSEGSFDPFKRLQAELVNAVFEVSHVYVSPEQATVILGRILPHADVHLSLLHAEAAMENLANRVV